MAQVQLDKDFSLDLQNGEELIYADKVGRIEGFKYFGKTFVFTVTTGRIVIVPKKGAETETVNYADILYAEVHKESGDGAIGNFRLKMAEKKKILGFIPAHKTMAFSVTGTLLESLSLLGKSMAAEGKDILINTAQAMENNQIYLDSKNQGEYDERYKKMKAEWDAIRARANASNEELRKTKKPTPVMRMKALVKIINEAQKLAGN